MISGQHRGSVDLESRVRLVSWDLAKFGLWWTQGQEQRAGLSRFEDVPNQNDKYLWEQTELDGTYFLSPHRLWRVVFSWDHIFPSQVLSSWRQNPQDIRFWNTHRPSNLCFKKSNNAFCIISVTCNWASNKLRYDKNTIKYVTTILLLLRVFKNLGFSFGKSSTRGHCIFLSSNTRTIKKSEVPWTCPNVLVTTHYISNGFSHSLSDTISQGWVNCS